MGQHAPISDDVEVWRRVPSVPEFEASSWGRIRRGYYRSRKGVAIYCEGTPTYGAEKKFPGGRLTVNDGSHNRSFRVSSLVCEAFHGARPDGMVCMHLDEDSRNNRAGNLSWGTQRENLNAPGFLRRIKSRGFVRKLSDDDLLRVSEMLASGVSQVQIAKAFGVSHSLICNLRAGRTNRVLPAPRSEQMAA